MIGRVTRMTGRHGGILAAVALLFGILIVAPALGFISLLGSTRSFIEPFTPMQVHALVETLQLLAGVALVVTVLGVGGAWLVSCHAFPMRRAFEFLLLLPLAFPTYLAAYVAVDLLHFFGPVQSGLRWAFGWKSARDYWFPEMRSMPGAIILLGLVLYPYVYVPCRIVFSRSGRNILDAARILGSGGWDLFLRVGVPIVRPALLAGLVLALLEALNDIGATEYLGISSLSVTIRDFWANRGDLGSATRMAGLLILMVAILLLLDPAARRGPLIVTSQRGPAEPARIPLKGAAGLLAFAFCALPVLLGFVVPVIFLLHRLFLYASLADLGDEYLSAAFTTLAIAGIVSLIVMTLGAMIAISIRIVPKLSRATILTTIGYATPGTVLALAILPVIRVSDAALAAIGSGMLLTATTGVVIYALSVRFLGIGASQANVALARVPRNVDAVARVHGMHDLGLALRIHLPAIMPGLVFAGALVFVDTVKELPATILLRPLNLETLATRAYSLASVGLFERAALESLTIVAFSALATWLVVRRS